MEGKVLVADDEQTIVSAIAYALRREGFQVETADAQTGSMLPLSTQANVNREII